MIESFVVYADALGTSAHSQDPLQAEAFLERLLAATSACDRRLRTFGHHIEGFAYRWFSDCLSMSLPLTRSHHLRRGLQLAAQLQLEFLLAGLLLRGAATLGLHHHSTNIDFGPALTEAAKLEELGSGPPRVVLTDALCDRIRGTDQALADMVTVDCGDHQAFLNFAPLLDRTGRAAVRTTVTDWLTSHTGAVAGKYFWLADYLNHAFGSRTFGNAPDIHQFQEFT